MSTIALAREHSIDLIADSAHRRGYRESWGGCRLPFATIACRCWPGRAFDEFCAKDKVRYQLLSQRTIVGPQYGQDVVRADLKYVLVF